MRWRAVSRSTGCGLPSGAGIVPSAIVAVDASDITWVEKSTGPSATCGALGSAMGGPYRTHGQKPGIRDIVKGVMEDTLRDPAITAEAPPPSFDISALTDEVRRDSGFVDDVFSEVGRAVV